MIDYLSKFLPNLFSMMEPIQRLTQKDSDWLWTKEHGWAMTELKKLVTSVPLFISYNSHKPLLLQTDASKSGLGAVLLQEGHPEAYASRALTQT